MNNETDEEPSFKWSGERWVRFDDAVAAAVMYGETELSMGVIQQRLREQCASGKVRSISYGKDGEVQLINRYAWAEGYVGLTGEAVAVSQLDLWDWLAGIAEAPKQKLRGKWPLVLQLLKEKYPPSEHPNGFPDPAFVERQALLLELRKLHPRLAQLDEATLDKAIEAYNREIRNSSEQLA
jgi:hypothetical protein